MQAFEGKNLCGNPERFVSLLHNHNDIPMKRIYIPLLMLLIALSAKAQTENISIRSDGTQRKDFGGFILDMGSMLNAESLTLPMLFLPGMSQLMPLLPDDGELKINPNAWTFNNKVIYTTTSSLNFSPHGALVYPGAHSLPFQWQSTTYKLNNGMRLTSYGEYEADGRRVMNPQAMPWQKQNFNAGFWLESSDGKFGIGIEVHRGRNNPF